MRAKSTLLTVCLSLKLLLQWMDYRRWIRMCKYNHHLLIFYEPKNRLLQCREINETKSAFYRIHLHFTLNYMCTETFIRCGVCRQFIERESVLSNILTCMACLFLRITRNKFDPAVQWLLQGCVLASLTDIDNEVQASFL